MEANAYQNPGNAVVFLLPPPYQLLPPPPLYPSFALVDPRFHGQLLFPYDLSQPSSFGFGSTPSFLIPMQEESSISLLKFMRNEGLLPTLEEEEKRKNVISKLKKLVVAWAKKVAWQRRLPREQIAATCATILTYGSYGLGVYGPESDIDALCVGPFFATMAKDFFIVLRNMLKNRPEVSDIHCVKDAKVPLMRFKFDGISVDLPYAQLKLLVIPDYVDVLNPFFLRNIDETSWKSLSGVRANQRILQLVPNLEAQIYFSHSSYYFWFAQENNKNFQSMLRYVKLWAKRRGVYGNLNGFLGGIHLAILAAYVCQNHPNASVSILISSFFSTFATWPWPTPVGLQDGIPSTAGSVIETRSFMPICLPCSPHEYCHSNITKSTFYRIRAEFLRGHVSTKSILDSDFDWSSVVEPFAYSKNYTQFVKIYLSASDQDELGDWLGWVKSRFRCLLVKLEGIQGFCDPNPTEYVDLDVSEPNVVFYWGLNATKSSFMNIDSVEEDFLGNICSGYNGIPRKIKLSLVQASELPNNVQFNNGSGKEVGACREIVNEQRIPSYLQHLPDYFVGYMATNGGTKPSAFGGCVNL